MKLIQKLSLSSLALLLVTVAIQPGTATAAVTFSVPSAPTNIVVTSATGGFNVSWSDPASTGNLPITQFVVDGGPGTCATTVAGTVHQTFVPAIGTGEKSLKVYAVNTQGFGPGSVAGTATPAPANTGTFGVDSRGYLVNLTTGETLAAKISNSPSRYFGSVTTPTGNGAWLLGPLGRVVTLGDAVVSTPAQTTANGATVSIVPSFDGNGYYLISASGFISYSQGAVPISAPTIKPATIIGGAPTSSNAGILLVSNSGKVYAAGNSVSLGDLPKNHYVRVIPRATGLGFWAVTVSGAVVSYGDAPAISGNVGRVFDVMLSPDGNGFYTLNSAGVVESFGSIPTFTPASSGKIVALVKLNLNWGIHEFQIDALSDFHGAVDYTKTTANGVDTYTSGTAVIASNFAADRTRVPATFTLSSGDNWGAAPPLSTVFNEMPSVKSLNYMGVDVTTFGNHEHDKGLTDVNARIAESNYKWVVANYSSLDQLTASNKNGVKVAPWTIVDRGGVKLGVVGINTPETVQQVFPGNLGNIVIGDVLGTGMPAHRTKVQVAAAITAARKAGADVVVSLVHEGWANFDAATGDPTGRLVQIAPLLQGSDIVLGGHSHLRYGSFVGNKLVAEVPNAGTLYNNIHGCVDSATRKTYGTLLTQIVPKVTATAGTALTATSLNQDAITMLNEYKAQLGSAYGVVVGQIAGVAKNGGSPQIQRTSETALGDYIADNIRAYAHTDLGLTNGGGIRDMLPAKTWVPTGITRPSWATAPSSTRPWEVTSTGPYNLTVGDIATVLPFGNTVATTRVTGAQVWAALENGVSRVEFGDGRFPQISGFKFTFDMSKPAGSRVSNVILTNGTPIPNDTSVSYSLATNDFEVAGGDGYTMLGGLAIAKTLNSLELVIREAIIRDSANGPVVMSTDGRITRLN